MKYFLTLFVILFCFAAAQPGPPDAPDLTIPNLTNQLMATSAPQLMAMVSGAGNNTVIRVTDGIYKLNSRLEVTADNVWVIGASKDPTKVILQGNGFFGNLGGTGELLRVYGAADVTIAYMTFSGARSFGVNVKAESFVSNLDIYNCHFLNIGTRHIKGTGWDPPRYVDGGSVKYCYFYSDTVPPTSWHAGGNYVSSLDMMNLDGWVFANNVFYNIRGATNGGRGSIFVWNNSRNCTIENNIFYNSDRLLAVGNPSTASSQAANTPHMTGCVIRNNVFVRGPSTNCSIELSRVINIKVYNNTFASNPLGFRSYRDNIFQINYPPNTGIDIKNNLVLGTLPAPDASVSVGNNYVSAQAEVTEAWFEDLEHCDLHITGIGSATLKGADPVSEVPRDIDGCARSSTEPYFGADEYGCWADINKKLGSIQTDLDLGVSPNPFHKTIHITVSSLEKAEIRVFDMRGKRVCDLVPEGSHHLARATWNAENITQGMYVIRAVAGEKSKNGPFIEFSVGYLVAVPGCVIAENLSVFT
jgi:hypothetical protein